MDRDTNLTLEKIRLFLLKNKRYAIFIGNFFVILLIAIVLFLIGKSNSKFLDRKIEDTVKKDKLRDEEVKTIEDMVKKEAKMRKIEDQVLRDIDKNTEGKKEEVRENAKKILEKRIEKAKRDPDEFLKQFSETFKLRHK